MKLKRTNAIFYFLDTSMKMFQLKWEKKKFGSAKQILLGMEIGSYLNFDDNISSLYKKAIRKL